ncbi:MAG: DUF1566 domain-containing protein [Acidobacteria bacterium]|nr:DUF1566 domain-containing protein [Acidobacteriota bacterium]
MRRVAALVLVVAISCALSETPSRAYWVDTSGLMWAGKDNGKDVSWQGATKYCRNLRLAGYSNWRLATIYELQDIYDVNFDSPGSAGSGRTVSWHVKGNLFLTGYEWSSSRNHDERGKPSGSAPRFDFNSGKRFNDMLGYSTFKRALCVRKAGN